MVFLVLAFLFRFARFGRFGCFGGFVSVVSAVSLVSFRWFRFVGSGFSTCRQEYPTDPLDKISAFQAELELAGNLRNETELLLGPFFLEKICWEFV